MYHKSPNPPYWILDANILTIEYYEVYVILILESNHDLLDSTLTTEATYVLHGWELIEDRILGTIWIHDITPQQWFIQIYINITSMWI